MEIFWAILIAVVIAMIVCLILYNQMKSVAEKTDARDYLQGNLTLTQQSDVYTRTITSRRKIERKDKNS